MILSIEVLIVIQFFSILKNTFSCYPNFCRESLAFATEPVFSSLANVLGQHENLPNPAPSYLKEFTLFDVEIKYGLLQVLNFKNCNLDQH